jgi:hypothetical protein
MNSVKEKWIRHLINYIAYNMTSKNNINTGKYLKASEHVEKEELKARVLELEGFLKKRSFYKQGTARQICLAFYYMSKIGVTPKKSGIPLNDAEFLSFITGLSTDNIRKTISDPLKIDGDDIEGNKAKRLLDDLKKLKFQFENILFSKGIELINNDIKIYENTIKSYKTDE